MSQLDHIPEIRLRTVQVTGPDAISFMQSQLTIDVERIAESNLYPAAWCSPDGRAAMVILIAVADAAVNLVLPESLAATMLKRTRMFSIGRKVEIHNDAAVSPATPNSDRGGFELPLAFDPDRALRIETTGDPAGSRSQMLPDEWLHRDIECGMPWILPETAGVYLPQMLGLDALGGLSYKKGCFPGQEVIARVHYRGRVTRRTARFRLAAATPPPPGREFQLEDQPAQVLYAVSKPGTPGSVMGLAVVAAKAGDNARIDIDSAAGRLL